MNKLRIVFMGTPEFAVGILDTLVQHDYEIAAVITAADKPAGRGQKIKYSAVKEYALEKGLKLLQPANLKDPDFLETLSQLKANLQIVVAFRMLPAAVWKMPALGTFNLHASLLPDYRGAAPINWAIINGETKTGVTTFFIDDKIDTGAMILKKELDISPDENAGNLHDRLLTLGQSAVLETLDLIANNAVKLSIQPDSMELKTAHKLNKENCKLNFNKSGEEIFNLIRGLSPYPGSWCIFEDKGIEMQVKIYAADWIQEAHIFKIGKITATKKTLRIAVQSGFLEIREIQLPGKKKMAASELMNGISFTEEAYAR